LAGVLDQIIDEDCAASSHNRQGVFKTGYPRLATQSSLSIAIEDIAALTIGYILKNNSVHLESIVDSPWTSGEKETRVLVG
jgi:hypothetical protein